MRVSIVGICLLVAACAASEDSATGGDGVFEASLAIQDLEDRDEGAVEACRAAVEVCGDNVSDAGPEDVCDRLAAQCDALEETLSDVRGPAVGCWKGVEMCQMNTPASAKCPDEVGACDAFDDDIDVNRGRVIECSDIVEKCLAAAAELPEETGAACDAIADACVEVGDRAAAAEEARGQGADNADELSAEAQAALDTVPEIPDFSETIPDTDELP